MACGSSTTQCLEKLPGSPGDGPVCCKPFSDVWSFNEESTGGRLHGCFVGVRNEGESAFAEMREGRWAGIGCAGSAGDWFSCDDEALHRMRDSQNGKRYLRPWSEIDPFVNGRDAFGMIHDLRSNEYHPVPRETVWMAGTCWYNDGRECFTPDTCECWGKGTRFAPAPGVGCSGVAIGEALSFILPDTMIRTGHGWPPIEILNGGNTVGGSDFYVRKFAASRLADGTNRPLQVSMTAGTTGGRRGLAEGLILPVTASFSNCNSNAMVSCTARIVKPTADCLDTAAYYNRGEGSQTQNDIWYNENASRQLFNDIRFDFAADPPRILECDGGTPLQKSVSKIKNRVLEVVLGGTFDGITFDRADSDEITQGNSGVGHFSREWNGRHVVQGALGHCRLQQSGCAVVCRLVIDRIVMAAYAYLPVLRGDLIEPHLRFGVFVGLSLETDPLDPIDCTLRTWDGKQIPLTIDGMTVTPDIDTLIVTDFDDQPTIVPSQVEWRGSLSGHSNPTAMSQRVSIGNTVEHCAAVANVIFKVPVPGWPMTAESDKTNVTGTYQGKVLVSFPLSFQQ